MEKNKEVKPELKSENHPTIEQLQAIIDEQKERNERLVRKLEISQESNKNLNEVIDELLMTPEIKIVAILDKLDIAEQVDLLNQISAKKFNQLRESTQKFQQSAKYHENCLRNLSNGLNRASNGDIVNNPFN